jgi:hypothetical protein
MSYCHQCSGGLSNIAYTFGGNYVSGDHGSVNSYKNSPLLAGLGVVSFEPRRVNAIMWNHVSTRGPCTKAPKTPTPPPTSKPTSKKPTNKIPTAKPAKKAHC